MKTRLFRSLLAAAFLCVGANAALAFYDPGVQRWINRDPLGELGFEILGGGAVGVPADGPNLYGFVGNSPTYEVDAFGLKRDCGAELNQCWRDCWSSSPPWPAVKGKSSHYRYCDALCIAEYMACVAANGIDRYKEDCKKKTPIFFPIPFPGPVRLPFPRPSPMPLPAPAPA